VTELRGTLPARILSVSATAAGLVAHLAATPAPAPRDEQVLAETGDGHVLASVPLHLAAGAATATTQLNLPPELRNQLAALRLARAPGAASVFLLDESARRRPVGLLSASGADTPLLGADFYVERALAPYAEIRRGDLASLLARPLSVLVAPDRTLTGDDAAKIDAWVRQGGFLIRFAGPDMAADAQDLLPEKLMAGDRQLGGALSWTQPQHLAPFPPGPFAGVPASPEVTVNRQVLAEPGGAAPASATWATLRDGTPLVTAAPHGAGEIVLFHVTANADWSNLPLSGLFVDMLRRLVQRAAGVATALDARPLPPAQALDGFGVLGPPPPGARPLAAAELGSATPSPAHPPGFYGLAQDRHAFNLGGHVRLTAAPPIPHATEQRLDGAAVMVKLGPWAIALALLLLCADLLLTLRLRGLLRPAFAALLLLALMPAAHAQTAASGTAESPALATHLAYVVTGDPAVDSTSKSGLSGLSDYVNDHTAAVLAAPAAVIPGRDDLSFYPLLYWPITAGATASPNFTAALNDYMRHGGIVLIDTRGGGADGAFAPGTDAALKRVSAGLDVPVLAPLTNAHVLARSFYLLSEFPGRYEGATVWVQRDQDRANDSVSPVIIGANDWAAAWATDDDGRPLFATIPGGPRQRLLAWRFGVNLVMYALTGNYKGDQVHVPAILQRLGQ
jgi:hypothetical protein